MKLRLEQHFALISPTFYDQLFRQYSFNEKLQSQTVRREKLRKTLSIDFGKWSKHFHAKKTTRKMLMKFSIDILKLVEMFLLIVNSKLPYISGYSLHMTNDSRCV